MSNMNSELKQKLVAAARAAREAAYAPYSQFKVGAALLLKDGRIEVGCNVENASYGLCICAERVAIGSAVAKGHQEFVALAVVTDTQDPAAPCGACRQVIAEFAPEIPVLLANLEGQIKETRMDALLPLRFSRADLLER